MKRKQILWAIVFGSMLAITGCGDDPVDNSGGAGTGGSVGSGGSGGSGGTGGSGGSGGGSGDFCTTLCESCGGGQADCQQACDEGIGQIPGELDNCPSQLDELGNCLAANDCNSDTCETEWTAWITCVITSGL